MNDFYFSAESRWFLEGRIPDPLHQWFFESDLCSLPAERTDHYLVFPNASNIGVKLREGRFEIKVLVETVGQFELDHIGGMIEYWEKWSGQELSPHHPDMNAVDQDPWIQVHKSRSLRLFSAENAGISECDIRDTYIPLTRGCQMELTEIILKGLKFWSLGFEAFSGLQDHLDILRNTMEYVFQMDGFPLALTRDHATSYPELLHRVYHDS